MRQISINPENAFWQNGQKCHNVNKCPFFSSIFGADFAFEAEKRKDLRVEKIQKDRVKAPPTSPRGG
jgi:hypothetical protein